MSSPHPPSGVPNDLPTPSHGTRMPVPTRPNGRGTGRAVAMVAVVAGIAGLAVGAAVVGGAWLLFGNDGGSSAPVSAPSRIGDYYRFSEVPKLKKDNDGKDVAAMRSDWDRRSSELLSAAYDGAGAVVQLYSDDNLDQTFHLEVVRAPSPKQFLPYSDAKELGLKKPLEEVVDIGAVSCAVRNNEGAPSQVMTCMRTADDLTVIISHVSSDLGESPDKAAALVDEVWAEVN